MANNWRKSELKNLELSEQQLVKSWFNKLTIAFFIWNLSFLLIIIYNGYISKNLRAWNINYGDFDRSDIFYVTALGSSFDNPYEYHPELPSISLVNY